MTFKEKSLRTQGGRRLITKVHIEPLAQMPLAQVS